MVPIHPIANFTIPSASYVELEMKHLFPALALLVLTVTFFTVKLASAEPQGWKEIQLRSVTSSDTPIDLDSLHTGVVHYYFDLLKKDDPNRDHELSKFEALDRNKLIFGSSAKDHHAQAGRFAIWVNRPASVFTKARALGMKIQDQFRDSVTLTVLGPPGLYHSKAKNSSVPEMDCQLTYFNRDENPKEFFYWQTWASKMNPELPLAEAVELTVSTKVYPLVIGFGGFSKNIDALDEVATLVSYHPLADGTTIVASASLSAFPSHRLLDGTIFSDLREGAAIGARQLAAALRHEE